MMNFEYSKLTGRVVTKDDFSYEESRKSWNRAIEKYPLAIVYCTSKEDVSNAIKWSRENNLPLRIRSGCHNYEGYSTGNDVLVIDVSQMNKIYIDEEKNQVKIEGGVRNRELYKATGERNYPFPGGGCPTVGVSGLTLGGGWGYSSRMLGLSCDSLIELELIDCNGNLIVASEDKNSDLFWACKGAGNGNFGVVVSMSFSLPEKKEMGTLITIDYLNLTVDEYIEIFKVWQKEIKTLDIRLNMKVSMYNSIDKGKGIRIIGVFYGSKEEADEILKPFKNAISKVSCNLEYMKVSEINREIQDSHPDYERYKSSGRFVYRDYREEEIISLINIIEDMPEGSTYTAISLYGLGGKILDTPKDSAAFYYRDAKAIIGFQSVWEDPKYAPINRKWVVDNFTYIKSITKGSFINFPLAELENYETEYYGENIEKLRLIKKKYDPENVFEFSQGIQPYN